LVSVFSVSVFSVSLLSYTRFLWPTVYNKYTCRSRFSRYARVIGQINRDWEWGTPTWTFAVIGVGPSQTFWGPNPSKFLSIPSLLSQEIGWKNCLENPKWPNFVEWEVKPDIIGLYVVQSLPSHHPFLPLPSNPKPIVIFQSDFSECPSHWGPLLPRFRGVSDIGTLTWSAPKFARGMPWSQL